MVLMTNEQLMKMEKHAFSRLQRASARHIIKHHERTIMLCKYIRELHATIETFEILTETQKILEKA